MSALLPDPLGFAVTALEAVGALCERSGDGARAAAILPREVAARLALAEDVTLAREGATSGEEACGLGSPLLEKLVAEARGRCPSASLRLDVAPPRPAQVRALAERFVLRNGLAEVGQISAGTARYAAVYLAFVVEADDRREGLVRLVTDAGGAEPDAGVQAALDPISPDVALVPADPAPPSGFARWAAARAAVLLRSATAPFIADVARRHGRDHERIAAYFAALVTEARAPRRKVEAQAVEAKVQHLLAERDKKLRDLDARFTAKVRASLAAVLWAEVPAGLAEVKLRRRKESRDLVLQVPALAHAVDRIGCEGCGAATAKPAACDERLHLLCEGCAPSAQGRIACPACRRAR